MKRGEKQMIKSIIREIREQIGDYVMLEEAGGFCFYSCGDHITIRNLNNDQEVKVYRVFDDDTKIMIETPLDRKLPTKKEVTKWLKTALVIAKKSLSGKEYGRLEEKETELLKELKDIKRKIKEIA